jgi:DNA (cytosine-5)-methyltransferase 1
MPAKAIATETSVRTAIAHLRTRGERPSVRNIRWVLAGCPSDRSTGRGSPNQVLELQRSILANGSSSVDPRHTDISSSSDTLPIYGSLCSGIEAAGTALRPLGWRPAWLCEIERTASAVLRRRHDAIDIPRGTRAAAIVDRAIQDRLVPNLHDMRRKDFVSLAVKAARGQRLDLLVGGTPCVSFSSAGLRRGMRDPAGRLMLRFLDITAQLKPRVTLWENVDAVLGSDNAFGKLLGGLLGRSDLLPDEIQLRPRNRSGRAGWASMPWGSTEHRDVRIAWRVLDSRHFGSPQRRARVFVLASMDPAIDPRAVLFEHAGNGSAVQPVDEDQGLGRSILDELSTLFAERKEAPDNLRGREITVRAPYAVSQINIYRPGVGTMRASGGDAGGGSETLLVPMRIRIDEPPTQDPDGRLGGGRFTPLAVMPARRLSIEEAERQMGFPPGYTRVPGGSAGARFAQLGNTMNVQVMSWICRRLTRSVVLDDGTRTAPSHGTDIAASGHVPSDLTTIHAEAWPVRTVRTPIASVLDDEDRADSSCELSPTAARGLLVRHLLRGRRIDPLFAQGVVAAIAAPVVHADHTLPVTDVHAAAATVVAMSGFSQGWRQAERVLSAVCPDLAADRHLVADLRRQVGTYRFRDQVAGRVVRADHHPGIFAEHLDGIDPARIASLVNDPRSLPELPRDAPANQRTAEAVAALWGTCRHGPSLDFRYLATTSPAQGLLPSAESVPTGGTQQILGHLDGAITSLQVQGDFRSLRAASIVARAKADVLELLAGRAQDALPPGTVQQPSAGARHART